MHDMPSHYSYGFYMIKHILRRDSPQRRIAFRGSLETPAAKYDDLGTGADRNPHHLNLPFKKKKKKKEIVEFLSF